ncbi:potassium channel subfamily K member 5 isoform X3 [Alligator sinensis]|uniref:Potassium channel subfamily K member 5 isoform X3 n=1 Tax=Alligator sinensis TaxID=38654 RepID=A0A3Q0G1E9_ALLSI|nr:potassium channel subfamily K member 5 isoform X3 [Alligator sinensis]
MAWEALEKGGRQGGIKCCWARSYHYGQQHIQQLELAQCRDLCCYCNHDNWIWKRFSKDTLWASLLHILRSLWGSPLLDMDQCFGEVLWWACQEAGPVLDQERSKPEGWDYIEGLYFSFITITTIGFGDFVAGVNPEANYHALYRYFVELWIYLGLAWLSLFVNWKVSMFVEVHKAIKKRRKKRKESFENHPQSKKALQMGTSKDVNIFSFLSKKEETYNDLIKQIGKKALKSNNDNNIIKTDHSKPNMQIANKDIQVTYTKSNSFNYDEVSLKLKNSRIARHLNDKQTDSPLDCNMFVNQLDRISEEEGEAWDSRDCRPLIFENANITFVNEDDDEEQDLSDDEETSKSSMDDNLVEEPETPKTLMKFSSSDESTFTSNELETSVPYEQLMNEYNTVNNGKATT